VYATSGIERSGSREPISFLQRAGIADSPQHQGVKGVAKVKCESSVRTVLLGGGSGLVSGGLAGVIYIRICLSILLDWRAFISDFHTHGIVASLGAVLGLVIGLIVGWVSRLAEWDFRKRESVAPIWIVIFLEGLGGGTAGALLALMGIAGFRIDDVETGDLIFGALGGAFVGVCVTIFVRRVLGWKHSAG
jgi:hypothetical protein